MTKYRNMLVDARTYIADLEPWQVTPVPQSWRPVWQRRRGRANLRAMRKLRERRFLVLFEQAYQEHDARNA